jgi:hypothetical protein
MVESGDSRTQAHRLLAQAIEPQILERRQPPLDHARQFGAQDALRRVGER